MEKVSAGTHSICGMGIWEQPHIGDMLYTFYGRQSFSEWEANSVGELGSAFIAHKLVAGRLEHTPPRAMGSVPDTLIIIN